MIKFAQIFFIAASIFLSQACSVSDLSKQRVKSLDSLQGALNSALQNFTKFDSVGLNKLLIKYQAYTDFINHKINDTLNKSEAISLHTFYDSGNFLQMYLKQKQSIVQRLQLTNTQLVNLSADIQNAKINEQLSEQYFRNEWLQTASIINVVATQHNLFFINFQRLSQLLPTITDIIKAHNDQKLPIIVETNIP